MASFQSPRQSLWGHGAMARGTSRTAGRVPLLESNSYWWQDFPLLVVVVAGSGGRWRTGGRAPLGSMMGSSLAPYFFSQRTVFFSRNKSVNQYLQSWLFSKRTRYDESTNQCFQFSKQTGYDDSCWSACLGVMKSSGEAFFQFLTDPAFEPPLAPWPPRVAGWWRVECYPLFRGQGFKLLVPSVMLKLS